MYRVFLFLLVAWSLLTHIAGGLVGPANFWEHFAGRNYLNLAEDLAEGRGYNGIRCCMPLYPIFLSLILRLCDHLSWPLLLFHAGIGAATVYFVYRIAKMIFSERAALGAGFLLSIHPYLVKLNMQLIDTGLAVMLIALGILIYLKAWTNRNIWLYALAGGVLALATLSRPTAAVYTCILGLVIMLRASLSKENFAGRSDDEPNDRLSASIVPSYQRRIKTYIMPVSAFWLSWVIVMSPWWIHNYLSYHRFIPLTTHGGANFLKGHSPGYENVHPNYDTDWFPEYVNWPPNPPDDPSGYMYNRLCVQSAVKNIMQHPLHMLSVDLRKILWLYTWHKVPRSFTDSEPRWDRSLGRVVDEGNPRPDLKDRIYTVYWVPTLVLFLYGLLRSRRHWRDLLPLYSLLLTNALIVALTFADTRYRLDVEPCIAIWAAYGGTDIASRLLTKICRI